LFSSLMLGCYSIFEVNLSSDGTTT